jgi:hypothetical protein
VAYFLMVHKHPKQVRRLIERSNFPGSVFWVHVDAKSDMESFAREMSGCLNVHFVVNRCNGDWGWFPFVQANIEGIRAIEASGFDYDHLVILSGQDYLLCDNADLVQRLRENHTSSFVLHSAAQCHRGRAGASNPYELYFLSLETSPGTLSGTAEYE